MGADSLQWIGWAATGMTAASYFCRNQALLRRVQAMAALVWMGYGVAISARPIVAANVLVAGVALWTSIRGPGREPPAGSSDREGPTSLAA